MSEIPARGALFRVGADIYRMIGTVNELDHRAFLENRGRHDFVARNRSRARWKRHPGRKSARSSPS